MLSWVGGCIACSPEAQSKGCSPKFHEAPLTRIEVESVTIRGAEGLDTCSISCWETPSLDPPWTLVPSTLLLLLADQTGEARKVTKAIAGFGGTRESPTQAPIGRAASPLLSHACDRSSS